MFRNNICTESKERMAKRKEKCLMRQGINNYNDNNNNKYGHNRTSHFWMKRKKSNTK